MKPLKLFAVTEEAIKKHKAMNPDSTYRPDRVFQNNRYIVQVFANVPRNGRTYDKVMVRRSDSKPIYSWSDLFRIKNEVLGPEVEAIQFMPKVSELIDQANLYWFWVDVMKFAGPDNSKWNYIGNFLEIKTLNGFVRPNEGDWIVKGLGGEFYPCDKKVFFETYDIVDTL